MPFWLDDEVAQQIGPSELQAAGLEPRLVEDFRHRWSSKSFTRAKATLP
jgi:hypothetical protein